MMENAELDEPEKKRPHLSSVSSPMARNSNLSPDNKAVRFCLLDFRLNLIELYATLNC